MQPRGRAGGVGCDDRDRDERPLDVLDVRAASQAGECEPAAVIDAVVSVVAVDAAMTAASRPIRFLVERRSVCRDASASVDAAVRGSGILERLKSFVRGVCSGPERH
jgi:hypothetical protein